MESRGRGAEREHLEEIRKKNKPKRKGLINFEYLEIQSIYTTNGPTAKWNDTDQ
mgnify:CR=1 FL=1